MNKTHEKKVETKELKRIDILSAIINSTDEIDVKTRYELLNLMNDISISELKTRKYVKSISIEINGNEHLIRCIQKYA